MNHDTSTTTAHPWPQEAEQAVLGGLMLDNDAAAEVADVLQPSSFWLDAHRVIFGIVMRQAGAGRPADPVTVFEALRQQGHDGEGFSLAYLNALVQSVPSAANIRRYAEIVADRATGRGMLALADRLPEILRSAPTAADALDRMQADLAALARPEVNGGPRAIADLMQARLTHWQALADGSEAPGIPTGIPRIDRALGGGLKPGRVIVLAARPSVGKTSLATQVLLHVGAQGHSALMLSQEMPSGELMDRAAAHLAGVDLGQITTGGATLTREAWTRLVDANEAMANMPVFIDDSPALSLLDIRRKAAAVQRRHGLKVLVVDYLQLCRSTDGQASSRHHQIESISRGMKVLAKELGVCVLMLSQLKRAEGEPSLEHLKESGAIEEDADVVLLLHPKGDAGGTMLVGAIVAKNRGGKRGRLTLEHHGSTQRWTQRMTRDEPAEA